MTTKIETAKANLAKVRAELADIEAQYDETSRGLGSLLARFRSGEKKAGTEASKQSMKWVDLQKKRGELKLEEAALVEEIQQLEETARERAALEAIPVFEALDTEYREYERQFAELIQAAGEVGQKLRAMREPWCKAKQAANAAGAGITAQPTQYPSTLVKSRVLDDPEGAVNRWLGPDQWENLRQLSALPKGTPRFKVIENDRHDGSDRVVARYSGVDLGLTGNHEEDVVAVATAGKIRVA